MPRRRTIRTAPVQVRISTRERDAWHRVAADHGMSVSELVRASVRDRVLRLVEAQRASGTAGPMHS
jgi:hypothetical protein